MTKHSTVLASYSRVGSVERAHWGALQRGAACPDGPTVTLGLQDTVPQRSAAGARDDSREAGAQLYRNGFMKVYGLNAVRQAAAGAQKAVGTAIGAPAPKLAEEIRRKRARNPTSKS